MTDDFNRPTPDLRTTPVRNRSPWTMWISLAAIVVILALAWSYWPRTGAPPVSPPAAETTTTTPPASTMTPATPAPATPPATTAPAAPAAPAQ